jgi:hypothetical protein
VQTVFKGMVEFWRKVELTCGVLQDGIARERLRKTLSAYLMPRNIYVYLTPIIIQSIHRIWIISTLGIYMRQKSADKKPIISSACSMRDK